MNSREQHCPGCGGPLTRSEYDAAFRMADRSERLLLGIPGGLCMDCHQLYVDPDLIDWLGIDDGRCTFAIESDRLVRERAFAHRG
jgi:hypothetical protein